MGCLVRFFRRVFVLVSFEQSTHSLVGLPVPQLAVACAVPGLLALAAALRRRLATLRALGVVHELFEDLIRVQLHQTVHVFFRLLRVRREEVLHLVDSDILPVAPVDNARTQLWEHFDDEGARIFDIRIGHQLHFFETAQHGRQHRQLIDQNLIHVFLEAQQVGLAECCELVLLV